jgi:hypothetical protein
MQHIDGALKPREVEDPILATRVYTNFNHTSAYRWHRLPVGGHAACLDQAHLIADIPARVLGELLQASSAVSKPLDRLRLICQSI